MGKIMRNGVQYGVDTADVLSTVAECDASASGGKGTIQVASAKALSELNSNVNDLKKSVSDGKTLVANAITNKGVATATDATFETMANNIGTIDTNPERKLLWTNNSPSPWDIGSVGGFVTLPAGTNISQYPYIAIESFMNTYVSTDPAYTDMQIFETVSNKSHVITANKDNPYGLGGVGSTPRTFIVNYTAADKIYFYEITEGGGFVTVPYRIWGIKNLNFKTI